ncbi:uncharacterized protein LOC111102133 [Crassostrea virginica]
MSGWRIRFHDKWPHMSSLYSGGSSRDDEEQKHVEPGSVFDNVYENPSEPYGAYKFYMAPREEFVIQSEPHLYPVRAMYKEDDDRTSGYATSGGSNSLKDGSSKRILLCVFLIFLLICAVIAAVVMAVLISHQRRMKPIQPDQQQQDVLESNIRIANRTFIMEYNDPNSPQYKLLETEFCQAIDAMFIHSDSPMQTEYKGCKVLSFRAGSVIARYLLMFLWKDKKQTDLMVDQVGDFIKETIPKRGIWNPLLLNGESLNLYPVEITNVEPNLYPLEKGPREKGFEEKSISTTSLQNIHPTGVSFSRTMAVTTPVSAPSSDPGAAIPLQESEHLISTQRMDDKLYPSESLMQPRSEIFASALLSSTLISHTLENLKTEYSDGISNQFSERSMLPSMQGSHMDVLPTQTDDIFPKSELKVPSNSVRDNIDLYLQSLLPILPTTKQPPKLIDPLREFKSDNDFLNFFTQPQKPPTSSVVKDQTKDVDFDHLLSGDFQNLFPFLNQESISTPFSEPTTTQADLLKSQKLDTISTTLDFIGTPSMPTLQMFTSSSMMSDDQKLYTNVIPSILTSSPVTSAQVEHDLQMNSILPLSSQKPHASKSTILEKLKPTSQIHEKSSSVSPSKSSEVVAPSISTFGSDGDMFNFFSEASSLDTRPPKISSFSIGDPGLHSETDNTPSFGGFGDFFSQFSTIEDSTNDMLPPNILMGSAESTLHASVTSSLDQNLYSERVLDTVINNDPEQIETFTRDTFKPSAFSLANSERIESKSDSKPANFDDFTQSLQPSMTNSFLEKSQGHESVAINSIYSSTFSSTIQNPMSLSGDIFTLSQGQHDLRSSLSIQTNEVGAFRDSAKKTLVKSIIPSASFSDKITESHSQSLLVTPSVEHLQHLESYKLLKSDNSYSISSRNTDLRSSLSLETTEEPFGETILKASYPVHETTDFYSLTSTLYHLTATELLYSGNETPSLSYDQMSKAVSSLKESQSSIQPSKLTTLLQTQEMSYPSSSHQFSDKLYNFRSSQFSNIATDPSKWMSLGELLPVHSIDDSVLISHTDHSIRSSLPSTTYVSFEQSMPISDGLHFKMSKPSEGSITKSSIHSTIDQNLQTEIQKADIQSSESRYRETETMSALHRTPKNESVSQKQMTSTGFTTENELSSNSNILDAGSMGSSTNVVYAESMKSSDDQQKQSILTIQSETISSKHILSTSFTPTYMSNVNSEIIAPGDSSIIEYTEEPSWSFSASSNVKPSDEMLIKDGFSNEHTSTESLFSETSRLIPKFEALSEIKHSMTSVPFIESSPSDMMGSVDFESTEILTDVTSSKRESLMTSKITQSAFKPQPSDIDKFSHSNSFTDIQLKSTLTTTILGYSNSFTDFMLSEEGMGSERSELNYPMTLSDGAKHSILESGRVAASYSNLLTDEKSQNTPFIQVTISSEELHSLNPTSIWDTERQTEYFEKSTSINDISLTSSYNQNSQENTIVSSNVLSSEPMTYVPSDVLTNNISEQPYTTNMSKVEESKSIMMDLKTEDHSGFPVLPFSNNIETSSSLYIAGTEDTQTIRSTFQAMDKLLQTAYSPSKSKSQQTATIDQVYKSEISDSPLNKFIEPSSTGDQIFAIILPESLTKSSGASSLLHNTNVDSSFGLSISDFLSPSASDTLTYTFNQEIGTEPLRGLLTPSINDISLTSSYNQNSQENTIVSSNVLSSEPMTYVPSDVLTNDISEQPYTTNMSKVEESKSIMMDLKTEDHSGFPVLPFSNNIETSSSLYIAGTEDTQTIRSTFQAMDKLLQTAYSPSKSKSQQTATIDQVYKSEISDSPLNKFIEPSSTGDQIFAIILPESLTKSSGASSLLHNTNVDSSFGLSISDFLSPSASDTLTYTFNQEIGTEPLRGLLTPFFDSATVDGYMTSTADALDTSSPNKLMMKLSTYTSSATVMPPEDIYFNTEQTKDLGQTPQGITQNMHKSKTSMLLAGSLSTDLINIASFDTVDPLSESMSSNKTTSIELPKILETSIPSISAVNFHQSLSLTDGLTDSMFRWDSSVPNVESSLTTEDLPNSNILRDLIVNQGSNLQPSKLQQTITSSFSSMPSFVVVDQTVEGFAEVSNIRLTTAGITQTYDLSSVILTNGIQSSLTNDILEKTATTSDMGIFRENEVIQSLQMESGLVTSNRLSTSQANSAHMESDIDRLFTPIHNDSQQMVGLKSVDDLANFLTQTYTSSSEFEELGMMTINHINDSAVQFPAMPTEDYLSSSQPPLHSSPNTPAESFLKQTEIESFMFSNSENFKTFSLNAPASTTMTQAIDSNLISSSALISDNPTLDGNFKHKIPYSLPSAISSNSMPSDSTLTMITKALTNDVIVPSNSLFDTLTSTNPLPPTSSLQSESSVIQTLVWETTTAVSENILSSTYKLYKTMDSTNDNETTSLQLTDSLLMRTDNMNQILPTKASTDFSSTNTILNSIPLNLTDSLSTDVQPSDNSIIVGSINTFTLNLSNYSSTLSSQSQKYLQITSTPALFTSTVDLMTVLEGSESNISPQDFSSLFVQHTSLSMFQSEYSLVPSILALGNASENESNGAGLEMPSKVFDNNSMTDSQIRNLFPTKVETQTELILADSTTPIYQLMSSEIETAPSNVSIETQTYTLEDSTFPFKISQTLDFNNLLTASPSTLSQIQTDSYSPLAVMSSVDAMNSSGTAITSGLSSDTVTPIMEENPSLTTDSQTNAPIQTTPYDVFSDTLVAINEENASLNFDSQTINPNTPDAQINSTEYLFGSSVIFSSLESSGQVEMHEFISKSSTYESSFEFPLDKVFLDSNSDMYKEVTCFHTLTMVSVDDSYVLSEELSYGKGTSSQTSSILSTNGPLVTVLDVSPTLTFSMLTDSFSEKYLTNATILTSSPDHSLFLPQPASLSSLPFPNLTTEINSAGTKERETLGVDKDANLQDKKALQSIIPDTASSIIYSSLSEGYIPKRPSPNDLKMTTPLITITEQTVTSSALSIDMDYDDPFAAFFGNTGPAIPQWVIDMLGSVHDSPSSTTKLYFRH